MSTPEPKFSPGPWKSSRMRRGGFEKFFSVHDSVGLSISDVLIEEDALLIAAAPDLYASCKELKESLRAAINAINEGGHLHTIRAFYAELNNSDPLVAVDRATSALSRAVPAPAEQQEEKR